MGVVSNKVDINYLKLHTDVGNLDTRVTNLEGEMSGVYSSINKISTVELPKVYSSINEISTVELPKVYSSISAVSNLILEPVTGLEDRVEAAENSITNDKAVREIRITADGIKTAETLLKELSDAALTVYNSLSNGQILEFMFVRCDLLSPTLLMNFQGQVNPIRVGTDTFSGRIRCASIYHKADADEDEIPSLVCANNYAFASMKKISGATVTTTYYDLTVVPASGKDVFMTYKVY